MKYFFAITPKSEAQKSQKAKNFDTASEKVSRNIQLKTGNY